MTLADLTLPVTYEWGAARALVFSAELAGRLAAIQAEHGDPRHVPAPRQLTDGRFLLAADILTECVPGGLVYAGFAHLDASRFNEIEVMPMEAAMALLPPPPEPPAA